VLLLDFPPKILENLKRLLKNFLKRTIRRKLKALNGLGLKASLRGSAVPATTISILEQKSYGTEKIKKLSIDFVLPYEM
jgi:hypothetical protein